LTLIAPLVLLADLLLLFRSKFVLEMEGNTEFYKMMRRKREIGEQSKE
jgi:hypothetical protein